MNLKSNEKVIEQSATAEKYTDLSERAIDAKVTSVQSSAVEKPKQIGRLIANLIISLLMVVLALAAIFMIKARLTNDTPSILGYEFYNTLSGSMSPTIKTGSLLVIRQTDPAELVEGDIITFGSPGNTMTTHRIVEVSTADGLKFVTRGDANGSNDASPVAAERVRGKVVRILPEAGSIIGFIQTPTGLLFTIIIPGALILIYEIYKIILAKHEKKEEDESSSGTGAA